MPVETLPGTRPGREQRTTTHNATGSQLAPLYNVILLDDDQHTYPYVVEMLQALIGCPMSWAFQMAVEVDTTGRVILDCTTLEEAQILQNKVHGYGADPRSAHSEGSMTAILEPATGT